MLIAGPTASGKSALALEMARRLGGEIVNADSMQVYRELRVLTARPDAEEQGGVPHHLYGFVSVSEVFTVARWAALAADVISEIMGRGKVPVVVGGTGLYFRALLHGLSAVPEIDPDVREAVRSLVEAEGPEAAHNVLAREDPAMAARLAPADRQRLSRALEVVRSTGRSLADWQEDTEPGPLAEMDQAGEVAKVLLLPPRDWLYARCDARFDAMMAAGALEEVHALPPADPNLPALKALGVLPLRAYLAGECTLEEALDQAKAATRQYAKRQVTWFRNQCRDWPVCVEQESESINEFIFSKIIP